MTNQPITASVKRAQLASAVAFVNRTVDKRFTIPILAYVRLTRCGDGLVVLGTDLDREIFATATGDVHKKFDVTASCHRLHAILKAAGASDDVKMEIGEAETLILRIGKSTFTLTTLPVADFPKMGPEEMPWTFPMATAELAAAFRRVNFCISMEDTRYYLNGIYMQEDRQGCTPDQRGQLAFVATDGHKLGKVTMPLPDGAAGMTSGEYQQGFIIPKHTTDRVIDACESKDAPETVRIMVGPKRIVFDLGGIQIRSKLIDGTFPDYMRVIPTGNDKVLVVDPQEMIDAIKEVGVMLDNGRDGVKLSLNGEVVLSVTNPHEGIARTTIEGALNSDAGPTAMEIGMNRNYLTAILNHLESDQVELRLADMGSPVIFTGLSDKDHGVLFVQMPMRAV